MGALLMEPGYWHWWVLAVALVVLEVLAPGTFFLWLAVSAAATGLVALALPSLGWEYQLLAFALLALLTLGLSRRYLRPRRSGPHTTLNRRGEQYVGRTFTLSEPVVNGFGKIRVDDTTWRIRGEDLPSGVRVRVTGVDGTLLVVARDG